MTFLRTQKKLSLKTQSKHLVYILCHFFSLHASEQNIVIEETSAIKNIWLNAHFQSFILGEHTGVTINSKISDPETLHGPLCLKDQHWSLLNTDSKNHFVIVDSLFKMMKKSHHSGVLPPPDLTAIKRFSMIDFFKQNSLMIVLQH